MKTIPSLTSRHRHAASRRGIALLLVLACLLLLAALILGFLLSGQNNLKSSKLYANGSSVKTLADSTVSLVMAQIQQATSNGTKVAWASQPGMIRTYDNTGAPLTNYRLYSWDSPTMPGAQDPTATDASSLTSSTTWCSSPSLYFDLNQPVTDSTGILHYPIIDGNPNDLTTFPAASTAALIPANTLTYVTGAGATATPTIEGFWVVQPNTGAAVATSTTTATPAGPAVTATNNDIPMPVKWLYVLKDGTIAAPTSGGVGTQVTVSAASSTNPIVGRIAYWTDDETSKVNINTASEGVYWDTPHTVGAFDWSTLAMDQPAQNEYQRYPGHPATTCLSTVLGSIYQVSHNGTSATPYTASQFMPYYALAPKLNVGSSTITVNPATDNLGSYAGTRPPVLNYNSTTTAANGTGSLSTKTDRLYASVDELAFESGLPNGLLPATLPGATGVTATSSYQRTTSNNGGVNNTIAGANSSAQQFLEKARFFLTANSRAPDVNLFNQPRIVCWPIGSKPAMQTVYDKTIAWCGTLNQNSFYFRRQRNDDPTNDLPTTTGIGLNRNRNLMNYLQNETSQAVPGFGGNFLTKYDSSTATYAQGSGSTVASSKQAAELDQILTEIFDYIRCLNLMDPILAPANEFAPAVGGQSANTKPPPPFYPGYQTVWTTATAWGGQGQVVPIIDQTANGGYNSTTFTGGTRGFGRFPTVEGATLLFICTGWNDGTQGAWSTSDPNYNSVLYSSTAGDRGDPAAWTWATAPPVPPPGYAGYTTYTPGPPASFTPFPTLGAYPPLTVTSYTPLSPAYVNGVAQTTVVTNPKPGPYTASNPATYTMPGTIIPNNHVRIQAMLIVNMFDPSYGNPGENGNYHLQVTGLDSFAWNGVGMGFPASSLSSALGASNYTSGMTNWVFSPVARDNFGGKMDFLNLIWGTGPGNAPAVGNSGYYPFFSDTIDLPYTPSSAWSVGSNPPPFTFTGGKINIYVQIGQTPQNSAGTAYANSWKVNQPVQTVTLTFPNGTFPTPILDWRVPYLSNTTSPWPAYSKRFPFGSKLTYSSETTGSQYTLIQPQDVTRSVRAYPGDIRIIAGRTVADATTDINLFDDSNQSHFPEYATTAQPHNHDIWNSTAEPLFGAKWGQLVAGVTYSGSGGGGGMPWSPAGLGWTDNTSLYGVTHISGGASVTPAYTGPGGGSTACDTGLWGGNCPSNGAYIGGGTSGVQGDFDNGFALWADGPYINRADEGDYQYQIFYAATPGPPPVAAHYSTDTPYFSEWYSEANVSGSGTTFFSPNRMMPSPGMFGSLPTGVIRNIPWMTLQFRPFPVGHPGLGTSTNSKGIGPPYSTTTGKGPPDHLFMDLFNMPVVEPYPISEPLSTAGRINMNYQIVPFTYIQRSTGVRAVLKAERMTVIPNSTANAYKGINSTSASKDNAHNYRVPISLDQTLMGFENWFNGTTTGTPDIFRSATQICDLYLYPSIDADMTTAGPLFNTDSSNTNITTFWSNHLVTGDNSLERPYTNIYPRLTTKSNSFTVHYCVETLQKVTGSTATLWDETKDQVTGQFRGSTTIERYVDPNDTSLPDFAAYSGSTGPNYNTALDSWYKFRVVSTKQFAP